MGIKTLSLDPRVTVRKPGAPNPEGECVVYWMQRAQRALDNPALDVAVELGNELRKPVVAFLAPVPFYPRANLRHYRFLASGIPDIEEGLSKRNVGFVLRTYPDHSLIKFCEQVRPAIVIGDENLLREAEHWRVRAAQDLKVPLWTVDADVIVPSRLLGKEHYGARTIRPRLQELLPQFLVPTKVVKARTPWNKPRDLHSLSPHEDFTAGWSLDRSVSPVENWQGGTSRAMSVLADFVSTACGIIPRTGIIRNFLEPAASRPTFTLAISALSLSRTPCRRRPRRRLRSRHFWSKSLSDASSR